MSLPVVLPGSCCSVTRVPLASQLADPTFRIRPPRCISASRMPGSQSRLLPALLPGRPLLSLGLLQLVLGCSMVALSFGALSLSSSPPIRNSCPFWAGSSVILSGIVGLTTWRRPMLLLVNLFVLLSVVCVLLNLAGFILCCQGAQLVSTMTNCQLSEAGDVCNCCPQISMCPEEKLLKLYPGHSCNTMRVLLKKVLFALCVLNALTTAVCLVAAALRYLQIFTTRRPCMDDPRPITEEGEETNIVPDPDEFVPPAPPPSYFSTFYSYTPRLARRMFGDSVIPLPPVYAARIKGVEVFCPLDPPPPYEAVTGGSALATATQETEIRITMTDLPELVEERSDRSETGTPVRDAGPQTTVVPVPPSPQYHPSPQSPPSPSLHQARPSQDQGAPVPPIRRSQRQRPRRSNSDPVLLDLAAKVLSCEAATQTTEVSTQTSKSALASQSSRPQTVALRRGGRGPRRPRPSSMVDYQSYRHTQQLVSRFLEQPAHCSLTPEVQELVDSIRSVLRSDQEHMEEAVRCASFIEQVITVSETPVGALPQPLSLPRGCSRPHVPMLDCSSRTLPQPLRKRPGLLHLRSCGDLSTFTWAEQQPLEARQGGGSGFKSWSRAGSRVGSRSTSRAGSRLDHHERPHSLIGVFRETVI
ncbi:protein FAM189A2-like [Oncorhynchus mykiss]|uniref:Endosomal transmembrane epsin interactor 1 n=1 Tax=Oncorhynchus mykiss TaxID=8022 RepID=A0A8L0DW65_ONCMY|nr:protein FAM189A2-like [Oncorhynchus mykiss]